MPIECSVEIVHVGQEQFHIIDSAVMRHAFDIHNAIGRFCDERIYQDELAQRCRDHGFDTRREVLIRAQHEDFVKPYYIDMLVEGGIVYELKAVETLNENHQMQAINYLLLADLSHGKLVNLRPASVESRFVSTRIRRHDRMMFSLVEDAWECNDDATQRLQEILRALLSDWGAFLDLGLYREALLHFLEGPEAGLRPVDIRVNDRVIGAQKMCLLNASTAWHISAVRTHVGSYETHLARLLQHTTLRRIHWINLDHRTITLKTIRE